ncbi:unnamed protein product [Lactuca virosa]|uniref:Uncharacterized protein n=1 Tax=Lactuca virosa TaxID=75947 RepID=A0AAU9LEA6_9ASTR|nr:unnamed protein product [Lactuca virosa]
METFSQTRGNLSFPALPLSEVNESEDEEDDEESDGDSGENTYEEGVSETWFNRDNLEGLEEGEIGMEGIATTGNVAGGGIQLLVVDGSLKDDDLGDALIVEAQSSENVEVPYSLISEIVNSIDLKIAIPTASSNGDFVISRSSSDEISSIIKIGNDMGFQIGVNNVDILEEVLDVAAVGEGALHRTK